MLVITASLSAALCCVLVSTKSDRLDHFLAVPLEQRFRPADVSAPKSLTGIIVLSGGAKRFSEAGRLARHYPNLKVVASDRENMAGVLAELGGGIEPSRIVLETQSENTYENALFCTALIRPRPGERWLLVTGALHMPRAIGSFRAMGFGVEPWPVYDGASPDPSIIEAMHEWLGLIAYRLLGRISEVFPSPASTI